MSNIICFEIVNINSLGITVKSGKTNILFEVLAMSRV